MFFQRTLQRLLGAIFILLTIIPAAGAATPLHKVVFVFAGFNERTGYIFVAKDLRFFEEQGLDAKFAKLKAEDLVDERLVRKLERDGVFK